MNSAAIPAILVESELRAEVEKLLVEGESMSALVEAAVRSAIRERKSQGDFLARGVRSLARAKQTGSYVEADDVLRKLDEKVTAAKTRKPLARS